MKTKKFFMLLAAMLLMSASAMAQSGNSEPIRGDLNGDGEVGMPDIMFIAQKMLTGSFPDEKYYYSAGTDEVTISNYTTANDATEINSLSKLPKSLDISSISGEEVYIVLPKGYTATIKTSDDQPVEIITVATVNNHNIFKTNGTVGSGSTCNISEDKYYLGVISDEDIQNQNAVNSLINNSTTTTNTPLTSITLPSGAPSNDGYEHIFIYPSSWGTPWVVNRRTSSPVGLGPLSDCLISNPTGYGAFYLATPKSNAGLILDITWTK